MVSSISLTSGHDPSGLRNFYLTNNSRAGGNQQNFMTGMGDYHFMCPPPPPQTFGPSRRRRVAVEAQVSEEPDEPEVGSWDSMEVDSGNGRSPMDGQSIIEEDVPPQTAKEPAQVQTVQEHLVEQDSEQQDPVQQDSVRQTVPLTESSRRLLCGGCEESGHELATCICTDEDGFVPGCVFCNVAEHQTVNCQRYPADLNGRFKVLVENRQKMPPLAGADWFSVFIDYKTVNSHSPDLDGYPWTPAFGKTYWDGTLYWPLRAKLDADPLGGRVEDPAMVTKGMVYSYFSSLKHPKVPPAPSKPRNRGGAVVST